MLKKVHGELQAQITEKSMERLKKQLLKLEFDNQLRNIKDILWKHKADNNLWNKTEKELSRTFLFWIDRYKNKFTSLMLEIS